MKNITSKRPWSLPTACSILAVVSYTSFATGPAIAQTAAPVQDQTVQDIIVTAQKRVQNLQDVPVAVSAFNGAELKSRGVMNLTELSTVTPGLQVVAGTGVALPFLRGIGTPTGVAGNEASVAVYVDGVYYSRLPQGFLSLNNVERVEVLKGPQGTLFGRNSSGGVINIVTPDPSHTFSMKGSLGYGRFDTSHGDVYLTGGLSDSIAVGLSVSGTYQAQGWGTNLVTNNKVGFRNDFTTRAKLLFEPSSTDKFILGGYYSYSKVSTQGNTVPGFTRGTPVAPVVLQTTLPNFYDVSSSKDGRNVANGEGASLKFEHDFGGVRLTSITAYSHDREVQSGDVFQTAQPYQVYDLHIDIKQLTQELQLGGKTGKLTWAIGLFYFNALSRYVPSHYEGLLLGGNDIEIFARQRARSFAGYAQATYELLPRLNLTAGVRYTVDKTSGSGRTDVSKSGVLLSSTSNGAATQDFKKPTFRAALDYRASESVLAYGSYSRGSKSGNYNLIPFKAPGTRPETVDAFEAGLKTDLLDRTLRVNAAAFYYKVSDPQVLLIQAGSTLLSNAGSARMKGGEIDVKATLAPGLTGHAAFTYLSARYKEYGRIDPITGACTGCAPSALPNPNPPYGAINPFAQVNASGNRTPLGAKTVFNVGANYLLPMPRGDLQFTVDYYHNSGYYFAPDNILHQPAYDLVDGQIRYAPSEAVAVRFWAKNLLGEKYIVFASAQAGPAGYPFLAAPPRTYGMAIDFKF